MLSLEQTVAGVAGLICLGSLSWLILSESSDIPWPKVSAQLPPLQRLEATQPDIGPIERYRVEPDNPNPFIAILDREKEIAATKATPTPTTPKPPEIREAPKPLEYPPLPADDGADQPTLHGVVRKDGDAWAWLSLPGQSAVHHLKIGESHDGWTLASLDGLSGATVEHDGLQLYLTISPQDGASHADHASTAASPGGPPAEIQIAGLTVRPGGRRGSVWINGRDWPLSDVIAGRVPGVSLGMAGPDQLLVNGQPISIEALRPFGFDPATVSKLAGGGRPPPMMDKYRGRRPGPPNGPPENNLPPWMRPGGGPPPRAMPPNQSPVQPAPH